MVALDNFIADWIAEKTRAVVAIVENAEPIADRVVGRAIVSAITARHGIGVVDRREILPVDALYLQRLDADVGQRHRRKTHVDKLLEARALEQLAGRSAAVDRRR